MTTKTVPTLMDIKQVAERLGVGEPYVRLLVKERRIPFIKWGRYIRFDPNDVTQWLESAKIQQRQQATRFQ